MARRAVLRLFAPSLQGWKRDLDRLEQEPSTTTVTALDAVLAAATAQVKLNTHVVSGKLHASIVADSEHRRNIRQNKYIGTIKMGKGLRYAKYELGMYGEQQQKPFRVDWLSHPSHDPFEGIRDVVHPEVDLLLKKIGWHG